MALKLYSGPLTLGKSGGLQIAGGFRPAAYGTLYGDWDFSTLALADGTAIASVTDGSGAGHTLLQATGANQPLQKTNIQNGKSVGRFDGVNDNMKATFTQNQPVTIFAVMAYDAAYVSSACALDGSAANAGFYRTSSTQVSLYAGTQITGAASTPQSWHVHTAQINGASSQIWVDGTSSGTGNAGANNPGGITLGSTTAGAQFSNVDIGRVIAYSGTLSTANRQAVEAGLKRLWATP